MENRIDQYLRWLTESQEIGHQVVFGTVLPGKPPVWSEPEKPLLPHIRTMLQACGILQLYRHQARALDLIRDRRHVVTATPTASGKSLIYNLPVLEKILQQPGAKALYLFPLKALGQDQLRAFRKMAGCLPGKKPSAEVYDGDTTAYRRKRIRQSPPDVVISNPEMLHLSLLAHHHRWESFLSRLEMVVVDEVHTYRGILGSHMAQVFRRLKRICAGYGAFPGFIFSSATVADPGKLSTQLTGLNVCEVTESGAPRGRQHVVFVNPAQGPARSAVILLKAAMALGLRTIAYTQSRKLAELIALWSSDRSDANIDGISAYRSGFLPEERRQIESRLSEGGLKAVVTTSALELGIDIGDLDVCILAGYPGTVVSTLQRGGRVGRSGRDSVLILVAGEDALDQYLMRNPKELMERDPEEAVVNPYNTSILDRHIVCAAAEIPLQTDEPYVCEPPVQKRISALILAGDLLASADGKICYARKKNPHREVDLRGAGSRFRILDRASGESIGEIDGFRAFRETHPGAIYLHRGKTYRVEDLEWDKATVWVSEARVDYYTRVRSRKETEILEVLETRTVWGTTAALGRLKITDWVTGYEKWQTRRHQPLQIIPLTLPPQVFETEGFWFRIPAEVKQETEAGRLHFMGGIHAVEHAAIGVFPLLVMADRNDLGGISTPFHPQTGGAAVFIYDGIPGGAGLSAQAFRRAEKLFSLTFDLIRTCPCENGCPACVHSPRCGSGNRPIDKGAALFLLDRLDRLGKTGNGVPEPEPIPAIAQSMAPKRAPVIRMGNFGVLDLETRRSAEEVGGWHQAERMGVSCVVLYDSATDSFLEFLQEQIPDLIEHLRRLDLVVGFNINRFDYRVLSGCSDFPFRSLPTLDMLERIHGRLGYRLSLNHLAQVTLGRPKSADGLQALRWWKEGRLREILDYCRMDVEITRDLFVFGRDRGYLLFNNKAGVTVRVPVDW
jgi:DEAD/DEAH box helicase domain-containing protein